MYFSQLTLKPEVGQIQLLKSMSRNQYKLHQLLWNLFEGESAHGKNQLGKDIADFIFRADYPEMQLIIYLVSARAPENHDGIWKIATKPYEPKIDSGQTVQFYLRANPVVTEKRERHDPEAFLSERAKRSVTRKDKLTKKRVRHDVLMHAKYKLKMKLSEEGREPEHEELWQVTRTAAQQWMVDEKRQLSLGAEIDTSNLLIDNYQQHNLANQSERDNSIRFSSIDFSGVLKVTDPMKFEQTLFNGVGRSKRFGCGLMLIRGI